MGGSGSKQTTVSKAHDEPTTVAKAHDEGTTVAKTSDTSPSKKDLLNVPIESLPEAVRADPYIGWWYRFYPGLPHGTQLETIEAFRTLILGIATQMKWSFLDRADNSKAHAALYEQFLRNTEPMDAYDTVSIRMSALKITEGFCEVFRLLDRQRFPASSPAQVVVDLAAS
jgi:hypothetical protein